MRPKAFRDQHYGVAKYLIRWLTALDERQKLLAFGVDLRGYAFFDAHTPRAQYALTAEGPPRPIFVTGADQVALTVETFSRCYRFVLDTALLLGAEDYDFDGFARRRGGASA